MGGAVTQAGGPREACAIDTPHAWLKLLVGFFAVFALFQALGHVLASDHAQAGLLICAAIVAATIGAEAGLFRRPLPAAVHDLGLGRPTARGMLAAAAAVVALVLVLPLYALARGTEIAPAPGWLGMLPGLFAQASPRRSCLRGYLFRHLQDGRSFWRAALLSMLPFVGAHLVLFFTLPWPIALASVGLAAATALPLAHLFVLGGRTIWAPALLHCAIQGAIKVVTIPDRDAMLLPLVWIVAAAVLPYVVFLWRRPQA